MPNEILDKKSLVEKIDYTKLFAEVIQILQKELEKDKKERMFHVSFSEFYHTVFFSGFNVFITNIAKQIYSKNPSILKEMGLEASDYGRIASVNYMDFGQHAQDVITLTQLIQNYVMDYSEALSKLHPEPLTNYQVKNYTNAFDLTFNFFDSAVFAKQQISLERNQNYTDEALRMDSAELVLNIKDIKDALIENIARYVEERCIYDEEKERLLTCIRNGELGIDELAKNLSDNMIGKIRAQIGLYYLEFLYAQRKIPESKHMCYVEDYVRRLRCLQKYIDDLNTTLKYERDVMGEDLCALLNLSTAYRCLPYVGIFDDLIYQKIDLEKKSFKFGGKLKRNGKVTKANNVSVAKYYLSILKGELNKTGAPQKIMADRIGYFCIYSIMFTDFGNLAFDPIANWVQEMKRFEVEDAEQVFSSIEHKMEAFFKHENELASAFDCMLEYKASSIGKLELQKYFVLSVDYMNDQQIREGDVSSLFRSSNGTYGKDFLKYTSIMSADRLLDEKKNLFVIPFRVTFHADSMYNCDSENPIVTQFTYGYQNIQVLPIVFIPDDNCDKPQKEIYINWLKEPKHSFPVCIAIPYYCNHTYDELKNPDISVLYRILYPFFLFSCINPILGNLQIAKEAAKNLFIPLMRLHLGVFSPTDTFDNDCGDEFIRSICLSIEHLLNDEYVCSTQGIRLEKGNIRNKLGNAKTSMYHRIPKWFSISGYHDKTALIHVTSVVADSCSGAPESDIKILVCGEVTLFEKDLSYPKFVRCRFYKSFSYVCEKTEVYQKLLALNDIIYDLYQKGYRKILYIANAPYTSNMSFKKENLYFFNEELMKNFLDDRPGLVILPLFYNCFDVHNYTNSKVTKGYYCNGKHYERTLYIDRTSQLQKLIQVSGEQERMIAGVYNLYTGKAIGRKDASNKKNFYRNAVLYSTLYNYYEDFGMNYEISKNLIFDDEGKRVLMELLTIFHYSKYEAVYGITTKINPFSRLVDEDGILKTGVFSVTLNSYKRKDFRFNLLAFLSDVKKIVDKEVDS